METIQERYGPPMMPVEYLERPEKPMKPLLIEGLQLCKVEFRRASIVTRSTIVKQKSIIIPDRFFIHNSLKDLKDKDAETKAQVLKSLHREILYMPSSLLEERDKTDMCLLHRILLTFPETQKKDDQSNEMIKLVLLKSNTDFNSEDKKILRLLKNYDKQEPFSVKFFQRQILNNEEDRFMLRMLRSDEDRQKGLGNQKNFRDLLEVTFAIGSITTLEYLIKQGRAFYKKGMLEHPVLNVAIHSSIYVKCENKEKYVSCLDFVLNQQDTDINAKDINGNTALHLCNDDQILEKIWKKKPLISLQNKKGEFPFHNVTLEHLTNTLNSMVTNVPTRILDDPNFWEVIKTKENVLKNMVFLDFKTLCPLEEDVNILEFIKAIDCTKHLTSGINHSIITVMLELYWMEFKSWIKIERQAMFIALLLALLLLFIEQKFYLIILGLLTSMVLVFEGLKTYKCFFHLIGLRYKAIRYCIVQNVEKVKKRIKERLTRVKQIDENTEQTSFSTETLDDDDDQSEEPVEFIPLCRIYTFLFLDLPLLTLLILYSINSYTDRDCNWIVGVLTILASFNITLFISYFNEMVAHYLIMLLHVAFNGFKFLLSTFFIIMGFALSLMNLITNFNEGDDDADPSTDQIKRNKTEFFSVTKSVSLSILKTIVMATGEMEASTLNFHYFISYVVFVFFIFAIPIVFMNLLNGLALEDVQQIKKEAKFMYRRFQLMFLCEVDYFM